MYLVYLTLSGETVTIHNYKPSPSLPKLPACRVVLGESAEIESCTFTIYPDNPGYERIYPRRTAIRVYSVSAKADVFRGRVLTVTPAMDDDGTLYKEVLCEGEKGYLQDSVQPYLSARDWTASDWLGHLLEVHNGQLEESKRIYPGTVTVPGTLTAGTDYETTWSCIGDMLEALGGEIDLRMDADGLLRLDYLPQLGETRSTKLALGRNLERISKTVDASSVVTRLIPLGAELEDTGQRLTVASVNGGSVYINAAEQSAYGVVTGVQIFDDVTDPGELLILGTNALTELSRPSESYQVEALNLHDLGLVSDAVERFCSYPVEAGALGIKTTLRCIRVDLDVVDPTSTTVDLGDKAVTQSQLLSQLSGSVTAVHDQVAQERTAREQAVESLNQTLADSAGLYATPVAQSDGSTIYYLHDKATLEKSSLVIKFAADAIGVSNNGGQSYNYGFTANGDAILRLIYAVGLNADYITAGTISGIRIIGESGTIGGFNMSSNNLSAVIRIDYPDFTQADIDKVQSYCTGSGALTDAERSAYDVNLNGHIDSGDAVAMLGMMRGTLPRYSKVAVSINSADPRSLITLEITEGYQAGAKTVLGAGVIFAPYVSAGNGYLVGDTVGRSEEVSVGDKTLKFVGGIFAGAV